MIVKLSEQLHLTLHVLPSAKARSIAIPVDLDSQVNTLALKVHSTMVQRAAKDWRSTARSRPRREPLVRDDYKSIIERLQVRSVAYASSSEIVSSHCSALSLMLMSVGQHAEEGLIWYDDCAKLLKCILLSI